MRDASGIRAKLRACAEKLRAKNEAYKKYSTIEYALFLAAVLIGFFALRLFILEPVYVFGESMETTYYENDRILAEKVSYWVNAPEHGDIVVCHYPNYAPYVVKRVIGLPGDVIRVAWGKVTVNGESIDESAYWNGVIDGQMDDYVVPEKSVFVMGDNRNRSDDSRIAGIGAIPYSRIVGRGVYVVWPLYKAGAIGD